MFFSHSKLQKDSRRFISFLFLLDIENFAFGSFAHEELVEVAYFCLVQSSNAKVALVQT